MKIRRLTFSSKSEDTKGTSPHGMAQEGYQGIVSL